MVNIMLCCAAGMSTSLLVEKMKKEAEKQRVSCHAQGEIYPLPDKHPPPHRCLFCHRRK